MTEPPYKVGQRVRVKPEERAKHPNMKSYTGTVTRVRRLGGGATHPAWRVLIRRDGFKVARGFYVYAGELWWEPVPGVDLPLDDVAAALAKAVLTGDETAALALADRVIELCRRGGTK